MCLCLCGICIFIWMEVLEPLSLHSLSLLYHSLSSISFYYCLVLALFSIPCFSLLIFARVCICILVYECHIYVILPMILPLMHFHCMWSFIQNVILPLLLLLLWEITFNFCVCIYRTKIMQVRIYIAKERWILCFTMQHIHSFHQTKQLLNE